MYLNDQTIDALRELMRILASGRTAPWTVPSLAEPLLLVLDAQLIAWRVYNAEESLVYPVATAGVYSEDAIESIGLHQFVEEGASLHAISDRREIYNDPASLSKLYWELVALTAGAEGDIGELRVWRKKEAARFSADDAVLLKMVAPALAAALRSESSPEGRAPIRKARSHPERVKERFNLSHREVEVAMLIADGSRDKEVAKRLGISVPTVRYHLHRACNKMAITGRTRLASVVGELAPAALG